jgi:hypothetical protein
MRILLVAVLLVMVATNAHAYGNIERDCVTYNRRTADMSKYQHKLNYLRCVQNAYKRQEEYREKQLDRDAKQAIIDYNNTYQKNSEDMRRWMRANPGQPYPYAQPYSGTSQKTKVNRK